MAASKKYPPVDFEYAKNLGLDDIEWERICDRLGRHPNEFECTIFSALFSEEFSNKSTAALLETILITDSRVKKIVGSNLSLVDIGNGEHLALQVVSNNQQALKDPFFASQGSLGLAIQELSQVGAKPIGLLNLLRFGNPESTITHNIFRKSTKGLAQYANRSGIPVVGGDLYFNEHFDAGPIINCGVLGITKADLSEESKNIKAGDVVLYVGAATGIEGLEENQRRAKKKNVLDPRKVKRLKIADAFLSKKIISACAEGQEQGLINEISVIGVGGLATAALSFSEKIKFSVLLELERIPILNEEMEAKDILLSESMNRLLLTVSKDNHRALSKIFSKWQLHSVSIGEVIDSDAIEFSWKRKEIANIPSKFALSGSSQKSFEVVKFPPMLKNKGEAKTKQPKKYQKKAEDEWDLIRENLKKKTKTKKVDNKKIKEPGNLVDTWLDLLANPNLCSRQLVYQQFDQAAGANTFIQAGGDAAMIRERKLDSNQKERGLAVTMDSNSLYVSKEPYLGTIQSFSECMRNLAATGATPKAVSACLNFGNPNNYQEVCDLAESIRALGDACKEWDIPLSNHSISLFNGSDGKPSLPTPTFMMVGLVEDIKKSTTIDFKNQGDAIFLIGNTKNEIECSEYSSYCHGTANQNVPDIDFTNEKKTCEFVVDLISKNLINSAHDISNGGLAIALSECCMSGEKPIGAELVLKQTLDDEEHREDILLFSETSARFILSFSKENEETIRELCNNAGIEISGYGDVGGKNISFKGAVNLSIPIVTTYRIWTHGLETLLGMAKDKVA